MAKPKPIGLMACPECGFEDAEIKLTKGGLSYRYCPDCNAQYFARTAETDARLRAKIRPGSGSEHEPGPGTGQEKPVTVTVQSGPAVPEIKKPARDGFRMEF
jgi:hypothetical protein